MGKQKSLVDKVLQVLTHSVDPVPANLTDYDVVIAGDSFAGVMTKHMTHFTHGHKNMMFLSKQRAFDMKCLRPMWEQRRFDANKYYVLPVIVVCPSIAKPVESGISKIDPNARRIELLNGRTINYNTLILDPGLMAAPEKIEGFADALNDPVCPVFGSLDSACTNKYYRGFPLFNGGNAFIYIPEFPIQNEVESYNMLMMLDYIRWGEKLGMVSPLHSVTIINANDRFASKSPMLNDYIKSKLSEFSKVNVLYNTKLTKIDGENRRVVMQDAAGQTTTSDFSYVYVHAPSKSNPIYADSGISAKDSPLVPVDPLSLRHEKFENIFALGEGTNLPIQHSFISSIHQTHVVRHNVLEQIENRRPNAEYSGQTKVNIFRGISALSFYNSSYGGSEKITSNSFLQSQLSYYWMRGKGFGKMTAMMSSKKPGGPAFWGYQKFPKGEQIGPVVAAHH